MFGVSEKRLRVLFCSSFLELVGHVSWLVPVKISIVTCHGLAANSRTFKHNRKKKRLCMQHVYEVYGNKINKAFVKRIIYIYIYIYIYTKGYRDWKCGKCFMTITFVSHVPWIPFCPCDPFSPCDPLSPRDPFSPFVEKLKVILMILHS